VADIVGNERFYYDMSMMLGYKPCAWWGICWRFITPVLIAVTHTALSLSAFFSDIITSTLNQGWLDIYHRIYPIFSFDNIGSFRYFRYFQCLSSFKNIFKCDLVTTFSFSVRMFCWLMTCALSIFSVLDNFCQMHLSTAMKCE